MLSWTFNDLLENSWISEEIIRVFVRDFIEFGSTVLFKRRVIAPTSNIMRGFKAYSRL